VPLNSIQTNIYGILNGLVLPGQPSTLQAYIAPPTPGTLDEPQVYIWGGQWTDARQTAPRSSNVANSTLSGYRQIVWTISLYIMYQTLSDAAGVDQAFPLIVDAVALALWSAEMPCPVVDPTTNYVSQLLAIGENITGQMAPVVALTDDGLVLYDAMLQVTCKEKVQA
jgi:hypothetical protein